MAKIAKYNLLGLNLGEGTYSITARAKASGFNPSPLSDPLSYTEGSNIYDLTGTVIFNPTVNLTINTGLAITYTSNGERFDSMRVSGTGIRYVNTGVDPVDVLVYTPENGWLDNNYRLVSYGDPLPTTDSYRYYSFVRDNSVEAQTLTVINSDNPSETASFTMPSGYTFQDFIGSEYDTSGGKFTYDSDIGYVLYNGYSIGGDLELLASGTFYYAGEAEQTYTLSGMYVLKKSITYTENANETFTFSSNGTNFIGVVANQSGIAYRLTDEDYIEVYIDGEWIDDNYRIVDFGSTPQTVTPKFYDAFAVNAVQEISGSWLFNNTIELPPGFRNPTGEGDSIIYLTASFIDLDAVYYMGIGLGTYNGDIWNALVYFTHYSQDFVYDTASDWLDSDYQQIYFDVPFSANYDAKGVMWIIDNANPI